MDFTINWTLSLGTDKVFYSFKVATCESTPNQEINATNHGECHTRIRLEAFGQINAEYAFGIQPNQR